MATNSGSRTETFAESEEKTIVVPRVVTQSDEIATYFTDDLERFVQLSNINLAQVLQIPPDYTQDTSDIINTLYEDIAHMLRDQLITGLHILLSDMEPDVNTGMYPLRYHVKYSIGRNLLSSPTVRRTGGLIEPPKNAWRNARFVLLIDWDTNANERRRQVRRPSYCFDWVPEETRFDATNLICYREGGLTVEGIIVQRDESASAEQHRR